MINLITLPKLKPSDDNYLSYERYRWRAATDNLALTMGLFDSDEAIRLRAYEDWAMHTDLKFVKLIPIFETCETKLLVDTSVGHLKARPPLSPVQIWEASFLGQTAVGCSEAHARALAINNGSLWFNICCHSGWAADKQGRKIAPRYRKCYPKYWKLSRTIVHSGIRTAAIKLYPYESKIIAGARQHPSDWRLSRYRILEQVDSTFSRKQYASQ